MQPAKFSNNLKLLLRSFPQPALSVSAVQEQPAKGRKLCPSHINTRRDCRSGKTCNIRSYNIVTKFRTLHYVSQSHANTFFTLKCQVIFSFVVSFLFGIAFPCMTLVPNPVNGSSIERRISLRMTPQVVNRACQGYELWIFRQSVKILFTIVKVHILTGSQNTLMCFFIQKWNVHKLCPEHGCRSVKFPTVNTILKYLLLHVTPPLHSFGIRVIHKSAFPFPPFILLITAGKIPFRFCFVVPLLRITDLCIIIVTVNHRGHP